MFRGNSRTESRKPMLKKQLKSPVSNWLKLFGPDKTLILS